MERPNRIFSLDQSKLEESYLADRSQASILHRGCKSLASPAACLSCYKQRQRCSYIAACSSCSSISSLGRHYFECILPLLHRPCRLCSLSSFPRIRFCALSMGRVHVLHEIAHFSEVLGYFWVGKNNAAIPTWCRTPARTRSPVF